MHSLVRCFFSSSFLVGNRYCITAAVVAWVGCDWILHCIPNGKMYFRLFSQRPYFINIYTKAHTCTHHPTINKFKFSTMRLNAVCELQCFLCITKQKKEQQHELSCTKSASLPLTAIIITRTQRTKWYARDS